MIVVRQTRSGKRRASGRTLRPIFCAAALGVVLVPLFGCAGGGASEPTVQVDDADVQLARKWHADTVSKIPPYQDPSIQRYVQALGERLVAAAPRTNLSFRFSVLDSPGVFAYSFADGSVVVGRGLLAHFNSEAQLAAVLGHEIGHVVSRHQARIMREAQRASELEAKLAKRFSTQQARDAFSAFSLARVRGYSRAHEVEADSWSERLLRRAGYDPTAAAQTLRLFVQQDAFYDVFGPELWEIPESGGGQGVFATHPSSAARLALAGERLGTAVDAAAAPDPVYLNKIRGMVYGLPEHYGVQRGRQYVHPEWRIAFTVPKGWYLFGADERLVATSRRLEGMLVIRAESRTRGEPLHRTLEALAGGQTLESVEKLDANRVSGETAVAHSAHGKEKRSSRLAVLDVGERRVIFVGFALSSTGWTEADKQFRTLLAGARAATPAEAARATPLRVQIERTGGDGVYTPAPGIFADHAQERWELLNQLYPHAHTTPGQWIKTVR